MLTIVICNTFLCGFYIGFLQFNVKKDRDNVDTVRS